MSNCRKIFEYMYVRIKCTDGGIVEGEITSLNYDDETPEGEDMIGVTTKDGKIVGIMESEIESWEIPMGNFWMGK